MLGFARVELPSGMVVNDVSVLSGEHGPWASPPGKAMLGRDGVALTDGNGKVRYTPLIEFTSKEIRRRFSDAVIEGLRASYPDAFA